MSRNKYPEKTTQKIIDVATDLFVHKGYDNTSVQDIVNKIKMSKGAIYHHFKNKEAIWEAVCKHMVEVKFTELAKIKNSCLMNGQEKLSAILNSTILLWESFPSMSNYYKNDKLYTFQIQYINANIIPQFINPIVDEGISDGSITIAYPKEIAEALLILNFIWLNSPLCLNEFTNIKSRNLAYHFMLQKMGIINLDK